MNKDFHDLLVRYVNGDCTTEEIETINRWYEGIADYGVQLDEAEKTATKARILSKIRKSLPGSYKRVGSGVRLFPHAAMKLAATLLILLIVGLGLFADQNYFLDGPPSEMPKLSDGLILENQTGDNVVYTLSDGSKVQLEPSGRIYLSTNFSASKREVYLTGKAFFDIARDPSRPFYVYSGTIATRVLGTSFFVHAPANSRKVEVKVLTGKVSVFQITPKPSSRNEIRSGIKNANPNGVVLSPNQKVEYFIDNDHWVTGLVEAPVPVKPIDEKKLSFVFENIPIKEILEDINERFAIEVIAENEKISQCTFTGDVSRMALYDMLDIISNSIGSTYEVKGTRILISGRGCN